MTREESKMMQGIGIFVMIFYHLFNPQLNSFYRDTVLGHIGLAANPVPLYCILTGYGLYKVNQNGIDQHRWTRCLRIYICYWVITSVFVLVSLLMHQTRCTITLPIVVANLIDWKADYYPPAWFILPYCLLSLSAFWIFKIFDKLRVWHGLFIAYVIYILSSRMNAFSWFGQNIFQTLYILFPFVLGGALARTRCVDFCDAWLSKFSVYVTVGVLVIVLLLRYFLYTGAVVSFFWAAVIVLSVHLIRLTGGGKVLLFFGNQNLNMWMIHAWICWYMFQPLTNMIENSFLKYILVVGLSLVLSIVFNMILNPLYQLLRK